MFAGDSGFTFNNSNKRLTVPAGVRTNTIFDLNGVAGGINQVLTSNGVQSIWQDPQYAPGGLTSNVQFNLAGTFGGTPNFTFTDTTSHLKVQGLLSVGTLVTTVPRIFAQSGTADFAITGWDNQWIMAGGGSGAANSAGIAMGYNNASDSGVILSCIPGSQYTPIIYSAASHDFKTNGSTRMSVTQTPGGDGLLTVPILQATQIRDGFLSTGAEGSSLYSTGIGLQWRTTKDAIYSTPLQGPFSTSTPGPLSLPHYQFTPLYGKQYTISFSGTAFNSGAVGTIDIYYRDQPGASWTLIGFTRVGITAGAVRSLFPTMTVVVQTTAAVPNGLFIKTTSCSTNNGDFATFFINELV